MGLRLEGEWFLCADIKGSQGTLSKASETRASYINYK